MRRVGSACVTEAPLCVLLPGTLCDARLFAPLQTAWAALGRPGHGQVLDLHTLELNVSQWWTRQLARLPARFDVLGFSLGGVLALQLLAIAPARVRRLCLVATNAAAGTPLHRERTEAQQALWQAEGPAAVARAMLAQASPADSQSPELAATVVEMACATPWSAFVAQGELNASRPDGLPALQAFSGEVLLISGANDPWCGAEKQQAMCAAHTAAQWQEFEGAGHYLPLARAQALARATHRFFHQPDNLCRSSP